MPLLLVSVKTVVSVLKRPISGNGPATATEPAMMRSIRSKSTSPRRTWAAATPSSMCLGLRAPTMATWTAGFDRVHATASCATELLSSSAANRASALTASRLRRKAPPSNTALWLRQSSGAKVVWSCMAPVNSPWARDPYTSSQTPDSAALGETYSSMSGL